MLPYISSTEQDGRSGQVNKVALLLASSHSLFLA